MKIHWSQLIVEESYLEFMYTMPIQMSGQDVVIYQLLFVLNYALTC